jgi:hypothetical protein
MRAMLVDLRESARSCGFEKEMQLYFELPIQNPPLDT